MEQPAIASRKYKVGICESQPVTAEGLRSLLDSTDGLECAWGVPHLPLALQLARQSQVDVLLLDKHIGQQLVIRSLEDLRSHCPATAGVVWGASLGEAEALLYLQAGARGLMKKSASLAVIVQCLTAVAQGATWIDDNVAPAEEKPVESLNQLTPRETQVLELVRRGLRNREIASALGIRSGTVKIHLRHIFEKTGIHGRYSLALKLLAVRPAGRTRRAEVA